MRYFAGLVLALALGVMGCSETAGTGGSAGDGGAGGIGGDGGAAGTAGIATLSILVIESLTEGGIRPLEGLQLCETDTTNCVITDAGGNAALDLPADREISYTMEKEGYVKYLRADVIPAAGSFVPTPVLTDAQIAPQYERVMSPYPEEGTGVIYAQAFSDELGVLGIAGATFELVGAAGKAYYDDEEGNWSLDLTATTSRGRGGFVEVRPGEFEMQIGGVENCQVLRGWPSDSENTLRFLVREGYATSTRWYCPSE